MIPVLHEKNTSTFTANGIGRLVDAVSCVVVEERNGAYELTMEYPETGLHFAEIANDKIIEAQPNETSQTQPFRIYRVSKPIKGIVTVYAEHISYQLSSIPVSPFTAGNAPEAMAALKSNAAVTCPFTMWTNKTTLAAFTVSAPSSIRARLGGVEGSILDVYGGEFEFDRYTVKLHSARGANNGVTVRYGKNITDIKQEENIANVITGVYPYWQKEEAYVELTEKIVQITHSYSYSRVIPLDCSGQFDEQPTEAELRAYAVSYLTRPGIGVPKVSIDVSFIQLWQTAGNESAAALERVSLCDTVTVEFERLGISATAKVVKTEYDVLKNRYKTVCVGEATSTLADAMIEQETEVKKLIERAEGIDIDAAARRATEEILAGTNGYVTFNRNAEGKIYEILIMDTESTETAVKVWRWNSGGLGYSSTGYNGTFATAITASGQIVADFITTGTLNAALVAVTNINADNINAGSLNVSMVSGLANVATSGNYSDLSSRPDLTVYVQKDGTIGSTPSSGQTGFKVSSAGLLQASNAVIWGTIYASAGVFAGSLQAATGTFSGDLSAAGGTFTSLSTHTGYNYYSISLFQSSIAFYKNYGGTWSGQIDVDASYGMRFFSPNKIAIIGNQTGYNMQFWVPGTSELSLTPISPGTCNVGTSSYYFDYMYSNYFRNPSSIRFKENIADAGAFYADFDKLRPVHYTLKNGVNKARQIGFIAEEMEEVCADMVGYDEEGLVESIDYSKLTVLLVAEVKALRARVKALENMTA